MKMTYWHLVAVLVLLSGWLVLGVQAVAVAGGIR